jgi:eukaryotic-like serine/threonine-protein kinase
MNTWNPRANELFLKAREFSSPAERREFLDGACAGDTTLRAEVEGLLDAGTRAGSFLEAPACALAATADEAPLTERPGTVIGPYKLLEQIGEGGFGLVFMAEQHQPVRRKVAVKVLKPGMDTRQVIARFEAERQALALMDHDHIARVLDAGETANGRPYFAMELVRGVSITDYCDKNALTPRQRLELFVTVCQAIQHAHQKGIIHRDIKPSNVLVTLHDGEPVAKVIDFGIAKALGQQLTDRTLYTGFAQMIGTPLYMSPEQAEMSGLDVDTRSDIYSLGVLLYELLTGTTPFDRERLSKAGYDEIRRIIREEEPARPSNRLSTMGAAATMASERRQSDPKRLSQLFRGELDWIVMKALEKERGRRYETAGALAADIQHYLRDEPVSACPPSAWYRYGKFARRHKTGLATAALMSVALVLGTAVSVWQAVRATQAKNSEQQTGEKLKDELGRTQAAEEKATRELFEALVAEARANRLSRRIGQRFVTLDLLKKAMGLARQLKLPPERLLEMRNEAIAALALPDLRVAREWPVAAESCVHFDAAFRRYAQTDLQGNVQVRGVDDGQEIYRLTGLELGGQRPVLSPDGSYLAVSGADDQVNVWKLAGARPTLVLAKKGLLFATSLFSPDSRLLALQEPEGAIAVFEVATGTEVHRLPRLPRVNCARFHPDSGQLALAGSGFVQVRDLQTGNLLWEKRPADSFYRAVEWHPDGKTLAIEEGETIPLWDVECDKLVGRLEDVRGGGLDLAFNPAGTLLASNGWSGMLRLWDPLTGRPLLSTYAGNMGLRFSADGRSLAAVRHDNKVRIFEIAAAAGYRTLVASPLTGNRKYSEVAVSANGQLLAAETDGAVALWDLSTGEGELAFLNASPFSHVAFQRPAPGNLGADPRAPALLTMQADGLFSWPIDTKPGSGTLRLGPGQKIPLPSADARFAQSRDGRVLASAQFDGALVLHADQPDQPIKLKPHGDVRNVAVSPDGRWVATGRFSLPGSVKLWEVAGKNQTVTYRPVRELMIPFGCCRPAFSPDGKCLLVSSIGPDPVLRWDVETGAAMPFSEPIAGCNAVYSADGQFVVLETGQGVARLIDAGSGREYARLEDPDQHRSVDFAFPADGTKLACASRDGYCVHLWDLKIIRRELAEMGLDW